MIVLVGLACLGLTLYFSTLTLALRAYSRSILSRRLDGGGRNWLEWLDRVEHEVMVVTAFARWVFSIGVAACVAGWLIPDLRRPSSAAEIASVFGGTLGLLLLFAIAIPSALVRYAGEAILARNFHLLRALHWGLRPIALLGGGIDFVIMRLLGKSRESDEEETERHEQEILAAVSEGEIHGAVDEEQAEMIEAVVALHETDVEAIMTPRTEIVAIPADADYERVRNTVLEGGHSRIPVYEHSLDHIIGVLYAKDLLRLEPGQSLNVRKMMRSVPYVPESKRISELLKELRQNKVHIAIVLDEYGGTSGLVTIEDILEEVVGDIADEYDQPEPEPIVRVDDHTLDVDARVHVTEINDELGVVLPDDGDYETVGGFIFATLGRIPAPGEEFDHQNMHIRITDAEPRRINRVTITVVREPQAA